VYDLAHALRLAAESSLDGHEAMYIAAADNGAGRPLKELIEHHFGDSVQVGPLPREDAGGISTAKAQRLLGWQPTRSWRDYLGADGVPLQGARERLAAGRTGVQLGRAALS
jgi:UDP-glucose 4-epimerase